MGISIYTDYEKKALEGESYSLASSALHICICRGDVNRAVNFAKVCWRIRPRHLYGLLWSILFEDCGRDLPALLVFYKYHSGYGKFESLLPLIVTMCHSQKSRDSSCLGSIIQGHYTLPSILRDSLKGEIDHKKVIDLYGRWPIEGFDIYDVWDFGVGSANYDWIIELAERATKWESAGHPIGSPYFFMADTFETRQGTDEVHDMGLLFGGWFPLVALGLGTESGKIVYGEYIKRGNARHRETVQSLGDIVFQIEGSKHKNHIKYKFDFCQLARSMREGSRGTSSPQKINIGSRSYYEESVLPDLVDIRTWVLNTLFLDDMNQLKQAYADNWMPIQEDIDD